MGRMQARIESFISGGTRHTVAFCPISPARSSLIKRLRVPALSVAFLFLGVSFSAIAQEDPQLPAEGQKDYVSEVFPYAIDELHDRIALLFDSNVRDYYEDYPAAIYDIPKERISAKYLSDDERKAFLDFPIVRANKFYVFYGAYPNMQYKLGATPLSVMGHSNAALQRYAKLPAEARSWDFYIWSPDAPFWRSEYTFAGKQLPFHSYFIVHLASVDDDHTSVEVIEDEPQVQMGKSTSVDANGVLHRFDIREVEPTTSDREFLLSCMHQFMERNVPGRHYFNCRMPGEPEPEKPVPFTVP